jgi:hypothetical protein
MFVVDSAGSLALSWLEVRQVPLEGAIVYVDGQTTSPIAPDFAFARLMQSRVHAIRELECWMKSLFLQLDCKLASVGK